MRFHFSFFLFFFFQSKSDLPLNIFFILSSFFAEVFGLRYYPSTIITFPWMLLNSTIMSQPQAMKSYLSLWKTRIHSPLTPPPPFTHPLRWFHLIDAHTHIHTNIVAQPNVILYHIVISKKKTLHAEDIVTN